MKKIQDSSSEYDGDDGNKGCGGGEEKKKIQDSSSETKDMNQSGLNKSDRDGDDDDSEFEYKQKEDESKSKSNTDFEEDENDLGDSTLSQTSFSA